MKVLSIPSGETGILIHRHKLYICPHNKIYESKLGNHSHLSFRHLIGKTKGATDRIYEKVKVEYIDFNCPPFKQVVKNHPGLTELEKEILENYYLDCYKVFNNCLPLGKYLLVFVTEEQFLPNKPHPAVNNTFWAVYDNDDLLTKTILEKKN